MDDNVGDGNQPQGFFQRARAWLPERPNVMGRLANFVPARGFVGRAVAWGQGFAIGRAQQFGRYMWNVMRARENLDFAKGEVRDLVAKVISDQKKDAHKAFERLRRQHATGPVKIIFDSIAEGLGNIFFPIKDDPQLGASYSLKDWVMDCGKGNVRIIEHFLAKPEYAHLLNLPDGKDTALSMAAFGYLNGEIAGIEPSIEGFKLLVEDPGKRIDTKFLIKAGHDGLIPFDEWLLYEASYQKDAAKQARLENLKTVLRANMSAVRTQELTELRDRKDSQRRTLKQAEAAKQKAQINKYSFVGGSLLAAGAIWYWFHTKQAAQGSAKISSSGATVSRT